MQKTDEGPTAEDQEGVLKITVTLNGPYLVQGGIPLAKQTIESDSEGGSREWLQGRAFEVKQEYRLCRCGQSSNKPFCDSTHLKGGIRRNGDGLARALP